MPGIMSTSIAAEGLDVDEHGHVLVKLSDTPTDQWMEAFRDYWGQARPAGSAVVKKEAFSHFFEETIVFRGVDVDGFVEFCKAFTQDAIKYANERTQRFETERDARIRERAESAGLERKHVDAERAKARKVKFD
jgi:hypothetical protein